MTQRFGPIGANPRIICSLPCSVSHLPISCPNSLLTTEHRCNVRFENGVLNLKPTYVVLTKIEQFDALFHVRAFYGDLSDSSLQLSSVRLLIGRAQFEQSLGRKSANERIDPFGRPRPRQTAVRRAAEEMIGGEGRQRRPLMASGKKLN